MSYTPECDTIDFADRFDFSTRTMPCPSAGVTRENVTISRLDEGDDFNLLIKSTMITTICFVFWLDPILFGRCIQSSGTPGSNDGDSDIDADLAEELMLGMETGAP